VTATALARLLVPDVRGLPRAFWLLFTAALIDRVGGFVLPFLAIYLTSLSDVSLGTAGFILSLVALGGLVGGPVGGALADRYGRKPLLIGGLLSTAAVWMGVAFIEDLTLLGVAIFTGGVTSSLARPAMVAAIADVVPEEHRRRAYGLHYWAINLGFAFAASIAGLLVGVSWTLVFFLDAATSILAAALLFVAMKDAAPVIDGRTAPPSLKEIAAGPLRDTVFMLLVIEGLFSAAMFAQAGVPLAEEMRRDGIVALYGPLLAINGLLIVLLQPSLTQVSARLRSTWALGAGSFLVGGGFLLTGIADRAWQHGTAIAVWTLGEILLASTMPAVIAKLAPADRKATYQGLYHLSWSVAAFAPAAGALILQHAGGRVLWGLCFVAGLVGVLIQMRLDRSPRMH
jgi:MFS family permease